MKTLFKIIATLLLLLRGNSVSYCQPVYSYNVNISRGLPSEHVYYTITDRYGYLWMATENGVVKYNGYTFKTFNTTNGINNADIWYMYEDKKGRIWVFSISDEVGYIVKDKYVKCHIDDPDPLIYFSSIAEDSTGIWLVSKYNKNNIGAKLYREKNDTLHLVQGSYLQYPNTVVTNDCKLFSVDTFGAVFDINNTPATLLCPSYKNLAYTVAPFYSYLISPDNENKRLAILDRKTCVQKLSVFPAGEYMISCYRYHNSFYIISNKLVYIFDSTMKLVQTLDNDSLGQQKGNITALLYDSLWNTCIATLHNGVYINYGQNNFQKIMGNLPGRYISSCRNGFYLWNKVSHQLTLMNKADKRKSRHLGFKDVIKIIYFNDKKSLLLADIGMYWLDNATLEATAFNKVTKYFKGQTFIDNRRTEIIACLDAVFYAPHNLFLITRGTGLVWHRTSNDTVYEKIIDASRFKGMVHDSVNNRLICYNDYTLCIYYPGEKRKKIIDKSAIVKMGIGKIEKIVTDSWGNIFIETFNKIYLANEQLDTCTELLSNHTLNNAHAFVVGNKLVVAGEPGVLFCNIYGKGQIAAPLFYPNVKKINYSYASDIIPLDDGIILNTNEGVYSISSPVDSLFRKRPLLPQTPYRFVAYYNNTITSLHTFDIICITQKDRRILLDVINPAGMGNLVFEYKTDSGWQKLNANELYLPHLVPGVYTKLSVRASDDAWRSDPIYLYVYLQPYWWQSPAGIKMIWLGCVATGVLILVIVVFATRRIVSNKHKKKQQLLELELKAIHARINPHFIFNTLSTGLYFIRAGMPKEAFTHISAFAELLRSYMKSSKDKYITITDEIENLHNYIALQQARFDDKFDYEIELEYPEMGLQRIPSLLLQPVVENAITHGLFHRETKGMLKIQFKKGDAPNELVCLVDDDGIGRERSTALRVNAEKITPSYGNDLIGHLLKTFNEYEQTKITLKYIDKKDNGGTTVIINIKNIKTVW